MSRLSKRGHAAREEGQHGTAKLRGGYRQSILLGARLFDGFCPAGHFGCQEAGKVFMPQKGWISTLAHHAIAHIWQQPVFNQFK